MRTCLLAFSPGSAPSDPWPQAAGLANAVPSPMLRVNPLAASLGGIGTGASGLLPVVCPRSNAIDAPTCSAA